MIKYSQSSSRRRNRSEISRVLRQHHRYGYRSDDDDDVVESSNDDDVVEDSNDNNISGVEPLDNDTSGRRGGAILQDINDAATVMDLCGLMVKGCHVFPVFSVEDIIIEPRPTATPIRTNMQITLVEGTMGLLVCDPLILTSTPLRVDTQIVRGGLTISGPRVHRF